MLYVALAVYICFSATQSYPVQPKVAPLVGSPSALLASSLATSSSVQYQRAWQQFTTFSKSVLPGVYPFPALTSTTAMFISSMVALPMQASPAFIATIISAILFYHKMAGSQNLTSHFLTSKILQGVSKAFPRTDLSLPITPTILFSLIWSTHGLASNENHFLAAVSSTMFHAFLR